MRVLARGWNRPAKIVVGFISDRADMYLPQCQASLAEQCDYPFSATVTVDDSAHTMGMAAAVRNGWQQALDADADYLFWVEEDFLFHAPVDLDAMVYVLERAPHLAQVVLKRQPWSPPEISAGGIIEQNPAGYVDCKGMRDWPTWCEHTQIFSLNPCLIPRHVLELGWPDGNEAEMTRICVDKGLRFAFLGARTDPPRVEHVGYQRAAGWRL